MAIMMARIWMDNRGTCTMLSDHGTKKSSGKRLQFANWNMDIEIVDLPTKRWWIFP